MSRSMNFDVTAQDSASREFAAIATAAEKLEDRLKRLDRLRVEPSVQLNITPATRSAAQLQSRLEALRNVRATVAVDGAAEARREVTGLVVEMRKLRNVRVRVDVDGNARASVASIAAALRTFPRDIQTNVKIDIEPPGIRVELESIVASLRALRGTTRQRVDVDTTGARRSLNETILSYKLLTAAALVPIAIPGVFAATSSLLSLGGAAVSAVGALGLLPAAGLAGGAAMATLALGLAHVGDALGPTGTKAEIEKVNEALAKLSPAARDAVGVIRGFGPAFSGMRLEVQEKLFAGMGAEIRKLGETYLPVLKTGLGGVATELNVGAKGFTAWATSGRTVADVNTILGNTRITLRELAPAGTNVAAALTDVGVVGSEIMPELAAGATAATGRFREFVAEARRTGELEAWMRRGVDVLGQLGQVAGNTGGILGGMFRAADAAGADFLGSAIRITGQLDTLVNSARGQRELTTVFRESQEAVDALMPGVQDLSSAVLTMLAGFAGSGGLQTFTGFLSNAASLVSPLIERLGTLGGETLGDLGDGANLAVAGLKPLVGLAGGIVDGLGPIAPLALAAVIAFKGMGVAAGIFAAGAARAAAASAAISASIGMAFVPGSAAAAAGLAGLGRAVGSFGRALPIVGVAAVALGFALEGMSVSTDDAVAALSAGGKAADTMRVALEAQTGVSHQGRSGFDDWANSINSWVNTNVFGIESVESATAAQARQREGMTALQRAQQDVTTATGEYAQAVGDFTANSPEARAAAENLATAHESLGRAEQDAAEKGRSHTEQIQAQNDAMRSQISTAFAYEDAVRATGEAHKAAADELAKSGAGSDEYKARVTDLARAMDAQAAAAGAQAEALGGAKAGAQAYATEILRATDVSTGPGRDAFIRLAGAMDTAGLSAITSTAQMSGLKTEIITLPDGRTVTVVAAAERSQLDSVREDVDQFVRDEHIGTITLLGNARSFGDTVQQSATLANGTKATITLDGNNQPLVAHIAGSKYLIDATTGVMTIDGNPAPGQANLSGLKLRVDQTTGQMTIDANPGPANGKTQAAVTFANGSKGVITIDGNPTSANGKTTTAVRFADGSRGTITVDANQTPANGKVTGVVRYANGSTGTVQINARDLASPVVRRLERTTFSTHQINVVTRGNVALARARADGGYATPAAYASGGFRSMSAGRAEIVPPRQPRLIGDRMQGDEAFIPINRSPRSMSILSTSASRMGFDLVPRNTRETVTMRSPAGQVAGQVSQVMRQARGSGAPVVLSAPVDLRPLAVELRTFVQAALGRSDQAAVVAAVDRLGRALVAPQPMSAGAHRLAGADGAW